MATTFEQGEGFRVCMHCKRARSYHKWNGAALACPKPKPLTGYRFYAELPDSHGSKSASKKHGPFTVAALQELTGRGLHNNCVAVVLDNFGNPMWQGSTDCMDCIGPIRGTSDSPVASTSVSRDYLRNRCVRISQQLARKLHPAMFAYLEN
jgi:hypothetical protein